MRSHADDLPTLWQSSHLRGMQSVSVTAYEWSKSHEYLNRIRKLT